jgi:hypothetical protein
VLTLLAVAALDGGATRVVDDLTGRGLVTMASAFGPAFVVREMYRRRRRPDGHAAQVRVADTVVRRCRQAVGAAAVSMSTMPPLIGVVDSGFSRRALPAARRCQFRPHPTKRSGLATVGGTRRWVAFSYAAA